MEKLAEKNTEKNWLFPDENQIVTINDFREMVREAENSGAMSFETFKEQMNVWFQNYL
ncbi:hypothetical protein AGMMS4956_06770 [Bacteroidia bacterium]|nr:hypothetical protein AGMMS4956_06770 [Bacteroidia bacterium]